MKNDLKKCVFCKKRKEINEFYKYQKKISTRCKICYHIKVKLECKCQNCERIFNPKATEKGCSRKCKFLIKVKKGEVCWEWIGSKQSNGYGTTRDGKRTISAHRLSYELFKGIIPDGLCVCHSCDNKGCVNPDHLWLGTTKDNSDDMMLKCRKADKRGEKHHLNKLNNEDVLKIRQLHFEGTKQKDIADKYKIDRSTVSNITKRKAWSHI